MSDESLTTHESGSKILSAQRVGVCLDAAYQIESLSALLATVVPESDATFAIRHVVRGIGARISALNGVLMAGIDDELETVCGLAFIVTPNINEVGHAP
jgi:hypothetical protein